MTRGSRTTWLAATVAGRLLAATAAQALPSIAIVWRDSLFSPDQVETYRIDTRARTETGRFNGIAHCVGGTSPNQE